MLKVEIPVKAPSVWVRIKQLRINSIDALAPGMQSRVRAMHDDIPPVGDINGVPFDPILFESARVDALQQIYFEQGTSKARTAIYGWHFYCLAGDWISASMEWSVSASWWEALAKLMEKHDIDPGRRWKARDNPHGQFGSLKASPSDKSRELYFGTKHWQGMDTFTGQRHAEGLRRVWEAVGAL